MSADAQPNPKQRANEALPPKPPFPREKAAVGALVSRKNARNQKYSPIDLNIKPFSHDSYKLRQQINYINKLSLILQLSMKGTDE
uniref:Uncharacterized protein n=1 Tax=Heterorhabditis bacteriophora TaxID=37862 RepID=A0A1I7X740_HETBA